MNPAKVSAILLALVASVALVQAAGLKGAKGNAADSQRVQAAQAIKGPRQQIQQQQQEYLPPPPPLAAPAPLPPPRPQPIKGAGQVSPVFTPARLQPAPVQQQEVQQQEVQQQEVQQQEQEPAAQQQQEEIDPNVAAQEGAAPAIAAPARAAPSEEEANPRPEPYAFNYAFDASDSVSSGSSQREEQQDASGKVTGFYTLRGEDGRDRRVDYIADANGFRATISTNEMGTAPKDSADANWNAQAPTDAQLRTAESATQAARQRALANPQPLASAPANSNSLSKISSPRQKQQLQQQQQQQQQQPEYSAQGAQQLQQVQLAPAGKGRPIVQPQPAAIQQLQEPFEQIRQTELNARAARKSRHAPFYLFTV